MSTGKHIRNRISTLRHSIALDITPVPRILPLPEVELRKNILFLDGNCEYCRIRAAATADHFHSVIQNRYPTVYCNDDWNKIPCCTCCNSSKGNRSAIDWLKGSSPKNPLLETLSSEKQVIIDKFTLYDVTMQKYCQKKLISQIDFDRIVEPLVSSIQEVVDRIIDWKITKS